MNATSVIPVTGQGRRFPFAVASSYIRAAATDPTLRARRVLMRIMRRAAMGLALLRRSFAATLELRNGAVAYERVLASRDPGLLVHTLLAFFVITVSTIAYSNQGLAQSGGSDRCRRCARWVAISAVASAASWAGTAPTQSTPPPTAHRAKSCSRSSCPRPYNRPSRLEQILSARAGIRLNQFGYDQFGVGRPSASPRDWRRCGRLPSRAWRPDHGHPQRPGK